MDNSTRQFDLPAMQVPYSLEAEEAVLGAVLVNPQSFLAVASFLSKDDFYFVRHQYIWQALANIAERNEMIDYVSLGNELRALNWLNEIGGPARLTHLMTTAPSSLHAELYGRLVERTSIRRRLLEAADDIKRLAFNEEITIERVTDESEATLFRVTERRLRRDVVEMKDAIRAYFDQIEHLMQNSGAPRGLPTGFRDLDELLGGLQKSDLLIFAGRPGSGKTSFLLSMALNAAKLGGRIVIFSMEMGYEQLTQRLVAMETGINMQKLRLGMLDQQEYARFVTAAGRLSKLKIFIDDTPAMSPLQMRAKCRRLAHEQGLDLVIIDYMQLMNAGGQYENNRVQEISYISRSVKELARELNVPVFSAAQLSRAVEQRQDKRPQLSDLRESGCLAGDTLVYLPDTGDYVPIRDLCGKVGFNVASLNTQSCKLERAPVSHAFCTGVKPVFRLTTRLGRTIRATANHQFLTIGGWKRLDALKMHTDEIASLAESDIYWDRIVSIEFDGETDVYDLTVPGNNCFNANDIIAHNSLEQDSDIVMFLYRDVLYNEATEFPNMAEIIVAKHRNGPTDTIQLHFDKTLTRFSDVRTQKIDLSSL